MSTNAVNPSEQSVVSGPPYPALPGQLIELRLRISPDEHRLPPGSISLKFVTTPEPQPPSAFQQPVKDVAAPGAEEWIVQRFEDAYNRAMAAYYQEVNQERTAWQQAHPQRSFQVAATVRSDEKGNLELSGLIPNPSATDLQSYQQWNEDGLYAGIYSLQVPQIFLQFPEEAVIAFDPESLKAIAAYQVKIEKDYFHPAPPPPPPPKTETITGLIIEPPRNAVAQTPEPPDRPAPPFRPPPQNP